jgi:YD repeat-containing protein
MFLQPKRLPMPGPRIPQTRYHQNVMVHDAAYLPKWLGYDNFNRVTTTVDTGGAERTATTTYAGLDITQKNLIGQERKETHDAIGQLVQVLDSNSPVRGLTQFAYDAFGNLSKTTDPNGNVIAVTYDLLGRRTLLSDPDLGKIAYGVDPIGRTWSQESSDYRAKGRKAYTEFDLLGRMVGRYEPDLESHWIFDTASTGVGQLAEAYTLTAVGKDYRRVLNYDALGRPSGTAQTLKDATYASRVDYDDWGRPATATYQRGADAQKIFSTRYNAFGYVSRVERGSLVLWQALGQDASSRPYSIALGNGLVQSKVFNVHTGSLDKGDVYAGGAARVHEEYNYDLLGNVTTRTQSWDSGGFTETLHYDTLNRLDRSTIGNSAKIFSYDLAGNIQSKTGTGIYTYPAQGSTAVRPHAVSTVTPPGGAAGQFGYDDNGNLTSGSTFGTWTSFDMPIRLTKGSVWADFTYGPEHQRTSQHRSDGSWVYYAGAQEVDTAGGTTVKTYWPNGIGVEIDRGTSATELSWTHVDRLGSPIALTNETGGIREKLEYDVWGKRRDTLDNESTPDRFAGKTDNRGFTGHEI